MVVVRLMELVSYRGPEDSSSADPKEDESMLVTFSPGLSNLRPAYAKLWAMVLLMAIRDNASSVHYHPWRGGGALSYVVENVRYEMVPPPAEYADVCIDVGRSLFTRSKGTGFLSRLWRPVENVTCSTFRAELPGSASLWDAVCWSTGERAGAELFLIKPIV